MADVRIRMNGMTVGSLARVAIAVASVVALTTPVAAQAGTPPEERAGDKAEDASKGIATVVVTARRKEENLQSVPVAITAVSQEALENNNVTTVRELQTLVPSLTIATSFKGATANFVIRGQGTSGIGGNPAVAVYLNEVPLPFEFDGQVYAGPSMLFDLENVQILKGPQGTLFGRNTMGGAILLQTARPKNELGGRVQVGVGNYGNREVDAAVNIPIVSEKLLARIAFNTQQRDGYTLVQSTPTDSNGIDLSDRDAWGVRGTLSFIPGSSVSNDLTVTYNRSKTHGFAEFFIGEYLDTFDPGSFLFNGATKTFIRSILDQQRALGAKAHIPTSTDFNGNSTSLLAVQNVTKVELAEDIRLRNILGYSRATFDVAESEIDGTSLPFLETLESMYRTAQITEELQLQATSLDGRLDWVAGAFYLDQKPPGGQSAPNVDDYQYLVNRIFGGLNADLRGRSSTSKALYAQGTYAIAPSLRFTAGFRYTWDTRKEFHKIPATLVSTPDIVVKSNAPTWTLGVDYQLTPGTLLYVTSRRGFRAGGSQTIRSGANAVDLAFGPEFVTDVEGGFKADWDLGSVSLRTNGAIFYQDYKDIQIPQTRLVRFPDGSQSVGTLTSNAAGARLWGGELELTASLTPRLQVGANVSYLDFEYTDIETGVGATDLLTAGRADRVPWTFGVNGRYTLPIGEDRGEASIQASYGWRDKAYDTAGVNQLASYGLANASFNWNDIFRSRIDASLFVSNLTNEKYIAGGTSFFGFNVGAYGEPRMYGLRVGYHFGE